MVYWQLFRSFFQVGLFGFGGGYAILSLIQHEVETNDWMTAQEFTDIVAISQMTPGPIGINAATYVGYTAGGGVLGSVVATAAIVLPSLVLMLGLSRLYQRVNEHYASNPYYKNAMQTLRFTVLGLIAAAALLLMTPANFIDGWSVGLFAGVFVLSLVPSVAGIRGRFAEILTHPITLIVLAGLAGWLIYG